VSYACSKAFHPTSAILYGKFVTPHMLRVIEGSIALYIFDLLYCQCQESNVTTRKIDLSNKTLLSKVRTSKSIYISSTMYAFKQIELIGTHKGVEAYQILGLTNWTLKIFFF